MNARKLLGTLAVLCLLQACDFGNPIRGGGGTGGEGLTLTGRLVDPSGIPVAGAKVALYPEAAPKATALFKAAGDAVAARRPDSTATDAEGRYRFEDVVAGRYNLTASFARGDTAYALFLGGLHLTKSADLESDTLRRAGDLSLTVLDASGVPVVGASCFIDGTPWAAVSDGAGTCILTGVAPRTFRVSVSWQGLFLAATSEVSVSPGATRDAGTLQVPDLEDPDPAGRAWRMIFSTRWVHEDSILAYGLYEFKDGGRESAPGALPGSSGSQVQVYTVDVTRQCAVKTRIRLVDNAVPCYDLQYRAQDSLLFLSYLPLGKETRDLAANCGWAQESVPRVVEAGKTSGIDWTPVAGPLDTASLLTALGGVSPPDVPVSPYGTVCPSGCGCFTE